MPSNPPDKICATCGRPFSWRRKWADDWEEVRYCSKACKGGPGTLDRKLEEAILTLLAERSPIATCCPSEAARAVIEEGDAAGSRSTGPRWRSEMEGTRRAGRRLAHAGRIVWRQKGRDVDCTSARGPVRFARGPRFAS